MNAHELAADIGAVQSAIATGELNSNTAQEELNRIRRKALGLQTDQVEDSVIMGYRVDAIEQGRMLAQLIAEMDMHNIPDSTLFHLTACADMFANKVYYYFKLRNQRAAETMPRCEEVDHG